VLRSSWLSCVMMPSALTADAPKSGTFRRFPVGYARWEICIADDWRVLDVGSGHNPHPRANVLLEGLVEDDLQRGGVGVDLTDPRLVVGDALSMPFPDGSFDYAIASHVAEHVEDPVKLCAELTRVARRGYLETPGWLADMVLREDSHQWRVFARRGQLDFRRVGTPRPLGVLGEAIYAVVYYGETRPGHRTVLFKFRPAHAVMQLSQKVAGRLIRRWPLRPLFYVTYEWSGTIDVTASPNSAAPGPEAIDSRRRQPQSD
jgi:SAM-dependent methyltransferase